MSLTNPDKLITVEGLDHFKQKLDTVLTGKQDVIDAERMAAWDEAGGIIDTQYEYVDLGLASGTLWATVNLGASSPTDFGDFYMIGKGSRQYNSGDTEYSGTADPLPLSLDAAAQVWGEGWHIPTQDQITELVLGTTYRWVTNYQESGVNGALFTGNNGKSIFVPAAGDWLLGNHENTGTKVYIWGSTPFSSMATYCLYCYYDNFHRYKIDFMNNKYGMTVRAVHDAPKKITDKADKVTGSTEGNFAALGADGNLKDSGHKHSDYVTPSGLAAQAAQDADVDEIFA